VSDVDLEYIYHLVLWLRAKEYGNEHERVLAEGVCEELWDNVSDEAAAVADEIVELHKAMRDKQP
jgi:hypothetical protein